MTIKPIFEHDCDSCKFLGVHNQHDLYFCPQSGSNPTVIARFSSNGPDYTSGMVFVGQIPELTEAHRLATEKGLL